ncbi:MAG: hypothetical protein II328_03885 [Clostridia bacterium]|nr:hypothetical protein [Clostridia bacterium]
MTLRELIDTAELSPVYLADETREVHGAYSGDLLSWVMGRAEADNAFLTIMTNVNVVAVASLAELSCVIFCEDVSIGEDVINAAKEKGINLLVSKKPTFETALSLSCLAE